MILVDTSVWIDHIRTGSEDRLDYLLEGQSVLIHDFVYGEIAMGSPKNRKAVLTLLAGLHRIPTASHAEVMMMAESYRLFGLGLSYVDMHLLAAAHASADNEVVRLWAKDKQLARQAVRFGVAYI